VSEAAVSRESPPFTSCPRAFEEAFDYLHRTVQKLGVRGSDAEDLVQDVFVVMWRRWGDYQQDRPLRPWMVGIASHLACRHKQRRLREVFAAPPDAADDGPLAEERLASADTRTLVTQALAALPVKYRGPLVMHELDGLSVTEISRLLGVPLPTAYTRIRRGRLAFAAQLSALRRS
jgi:RNA polymerase sigma-70 factor (ECF subfamily)